jgi:secreted trypsin-like serine protease
MARARSGKQDPEAIIRSAIEYAEKWAGDDDKAYLRALNETYRAGLAKIRSRGGAARSAAAPAPKEIQIYNDPRYLKNARELAKRSLGGTRVVGGRPVRAGELLDCVAVGNDTMWGCTGTLIAPNVVVSAGHCVNYATRLFIGNNVKKPGKIVSVSQRYQHPDYRKGKQNDLLVLVLQEEVKNVTPRKLAQKALIDKATDGRVVGFGNTDPKGLFGYGIKRMVDVPIASNDCRGRDDGHDDKATYGCDQGLEFVAGKPMLEADSCKGDSGGPFYILNGDEWELAGATSRSTISAMHECGDGGIYVRLDRYRSWIESLPSVTLPK